MPRDVGIADRLRAAGLKVVEIDGWRTRGSDTFNPRGSVDHHTADGPGEAPSLRICTHGRSDLPGPLCNVLIGRSNTCYVIAAGRANHAGSGSWRGLVGNSSVYGIERENRGTKDDPWRDDQTDAAAKAHAALIRGRADERFVCGHREWTSRKVDAHSVNYGDFRALVGRYLTVPGPQPTPPQPVEEEVPMPEKLIPGEAVVVGVELPEFDGTKGKKYASIAADHVPEGGNVYRIALLGRDGAVLREIPEFRVGRGRVAIPPDTPLPDNIGAISVSVGPNNGPSSLLVSVVK